MKLPQISDFAAKNKSIKVSVYGFEGDYIFSLYESTCEDRLRRVNLMMLQQDSKQTAFRANQEHG